MGKWKVGHRFLLPPWMLVHGFPFSYCFSQCIWQRIYYLKLNHKEIDKFYSLHLLKEEQMDLPTVRNNLDVELQMQLNAQQVEASSCPD